MSDDPRTLQTRRRLVDATMQTIREQGIAKLSARTIATTGGVNQALVFYHFGTVDGLVAEACRVTTAERVDRYRDALATVTSFGALLDVADRVRADEREAGNVAVLAQVLAASHGNPALAAAAGEAIGMWSAAVRPALQRLLETSPVGELFDADVLTDLASSAFVGIELMEPTRTVDASTVEDPLARLRPVAELLDGLGPIARRAVRSVLRGR
ncbi:MULTISPECIES: TetR/AcrR family transcriptional regulator [unclassified Aeromicrobium]|uniref:TetR/AcrR family transcriptional regulator n=1 Tax=unclassified Aeromicrobium TaxID=2633570 RepID=UPI00288A7125|nr:MULTISPECIES: TetR/AcrR family transcriptional regulator [unclassified Aeromicrobium]